LFCCLARVHNTHLISRHHTTANATTTTTTTTTQWIQLFDEKGDRMTPDVVAKVGDDLRKDLCIATVGRVCEACK
jgi:hypothetical protein